MEELNGAQRRNIKLENLLEKIEQVVTNNFEVVSKLLVPIKKEDPEGSFLNPTLRKLLKGINGR